MKIGPNIQKILPVGVLGVVFALFSVGSAHAQILLTINDSDPTAVVITATGLAPSTDASGHSFYDGIGLVNFFTGYTNSSVQYTDSSTTLTTGDSSSGTLFTTANSNMTGDEVNNVDLDVYSDPNDTPMTFTVGQSAFTGSMTFNLGALPLPAVGASGTLLSGFATGDSTPIGEWQVVPEPSTSMLVVFFLGVLALVQRRRASRA